MNFNHFKLRVKKQIVPRPDKSFIIKKIYIKNDQFQYFLSLLHIISVLYKVLYKVFEMDVQNLMSAMHS